MRNEHDEVGADYEELTGELPEYFDRSHPQLASSATRALRGALQSSVENACEVEGLWDVFQSFVRRHEHGVFMDALVGDLHSDIRAAIMAEKEEELREEALVMLRKTIKHDVANDLREEVTNELRQEMLSIIVDEIRPDVEAQLRAELMVSADFIASVKADLQRKMLGL